MKRLVTLLLLSFFGLLLHHTLGEDDKEIKLGEDVYKKLCLPCHTPGGKSPIPDMNLADDKWKHGNSLEVMVKIITEGAQGTAMLGFKDKLSEKEIGAVAKYVRTFSKSTSGSPEAPPFQGSAPKESQEKNPESKDQPPEESSQK